MPRRTKPPRLWLRPADEKRDGVWVILHRGKQISTGCGEDDDEGAQGALEANLAQLRVIAPLKGRNAASVPVAEVLNYYLAARKDGISRPRELAQRIDALLDWWGMKSLDDITSVTCKAYADSRSTQSMARKELEDLRAAVNLAIADNLCRQAVKITLPPKSAARADYLEREQIAHLIWKAYRAREIQKGVPTKKRPRLHVARFILAALYTGSRSGRVWRASFAREEGLPWIDLRRGLFYRAWEGEEVAENKQAPPIRVPGRLLAHMRRWERMGARYVCEYQGRPADPKRAFRRLVDDVFKDGEAGGAVRHTLRHTAATWLMQAAEDKYEVSGFLGMTLETLENTYGHHHPNHQKGVGDAFSRGRAGRQRK